MNATGSPAGPEFEKDHFERLGLRRRFALAPSELEGNYLARSRLVHPDVHQLGSTNDQMVSLERSAALNEAYAVLRDPFRRAEYLLTLAGGPSAADHKVMAPDFLEEMLELRMAIEELRESGDPDSPARLEMEERLVGRREALAEEVGKRFELRERRKREPTADDRILREIREILNASRYIQGLLRDLRAE